MVIGSKGNNLGNLRNIRHEASIYISGRKRRNIWKLKLMNRSNSKIKNIRDLCRSISDFKKCFPHKYSAVPRYLSIPRLSNMSIVSYPWTDIEEKGCTITNKILLSKFFFTHLCVFEVRFVIEIEYFLSFDMQQRSLTINRTVWHEDWLLQLELSSAHSSKFL